MSKATPPPPVAPETWRALIAAAADFAALKPWEFMWDSQVVGLPDPVTGEARIATVLGNAGEVFAAVLHRRAGLRWILRMLDEGPEPEALDNAEGMDFVQVEFVPKRELEKEDLAVLQAAGFKPAGRGRGWPQFRAAEPGWLPWFLTQAEAEQLLADLPRLTAFCRLSEQHPGLSENRAPTELPFLPAVLPARALTPTDLDWRPFLPLPAPELGPYPVPGDDLARLRALKRGPGLTWEFDAALLPGGSFLEQGRPCFSRFGLLVEAGQGLVLASDLQSGALPPGEAAGRSLVKALLMAGCLPEQLRVRGPRLVPVLQPLCEALKIRLRPAATLPALEEAVGFLSQMMMTQR